MVVYKAQGGSSNNIKSRNYYYTLRQECIKAYGDECDCCGESNEEFLTLDHINGGGRQDRIKHGGGSNWLRQLRKDGFPKGYRVLCYNCNSSYGMYGYCPHKKEEHGA